MSEIELLVESVRNVREDLVHMEERLTSRIDRVQSTYQDHDLRIRGLESSGAEMLGDRRIVGLLIAGGSAVVGGLIHQVGRFLLER